MSKIIEDIKRRNNISEEAINEKLILMMNEHYILIREIQNDEGIKTNYYIVNGNNLIIDNN